MDIKLHAREHIIGIKLAYGQVANFWVPKTNSTTPVRSRYPVEFTKKSESIVTEKINEFTKIGLRWVEVLVAEYGEEVARNPQLSHTRAINRVSLWWKDIIFLGREGSTATKLVLAGGPKEGR